MISDPKYDQFSSRTAKSLQDAKVEQIAHELQSQGYEVTLEDDGFDLLARKQGHVIAYEVKLLHDRTIDTIKRIRARALEKGYEFRLAVPALPPRKTIKVELLEERLLDRLNRDRPPELQALQPTARIVRIGGIEIENLLIKAGKTVLAGSGMVGLRFGESQIPDESTEPTDYVPFTFSDLVFTSDQRIEDPGTISFDVSVLED